MIWGNPSAAWGFLLLGCVAIGWLGLLIYGPKIQRRFISDKMLSRIGTHNSRNQNIRIGLWLSAVAFLILALMQPRYGYTLENKSVQSRPILLAIDVSKSMAAEDIKPSRFEVARQHLYATIEAFQNSRIGLVVFAGDAYLQCPLTTDHDALRSYVQDLHPGFLPIQGTNIGAVLRVADDMGNMIKSPFDVFLFSDGEYLSGNTTAYIDTLAKRGIRLYTIGIGTPAGEPIPLKDAQGQTIGYKQDQAGKVVLSKLDAETLSTLATRSGGRYINSSDARSIEQLFSLIDTQKGNEAHETQVRHYHEWYMIPLSIGIFLLLLQWAVPDRRRIKNTAILGLFLGISFSLQVSLNAASLQDAWHYQQGKKAFLSEQYPEAAASFTKVSEADPGRSYYNLGNVAYQAKEFEAAESYYENAAPHLKTAAEKAWLTYNQGNVAFSQNKLKEAVAFYRKSLTYNPDDKDTKMNLELTLKKMKEKPPTPKKPEPPKPPQEDKKDPQKEQKKQAANQILKTLRQKEQFNTMPPMTKTPPTDKDW
jgi:Ca-activated chloride channel family protein